MQSIRRIDIKKFGTQGTRTHDNMLESERTKRDLRPFFVTVFPHVIVQTRSTGKTPLRRSRKGRRFFMYSEGHKQGGDAH